MEGDKHITNSLHTILQPDEFRGYCTELSFVLTLQLTLTPTRWFMCWDTIHVTIIADILTQANTPTMLLCRQNQAKEWRCLRAEQQVPLVAVLAFLQATHSHPSLGPQGNAKYEKLRNPYMSCTTSYGKRQYDRTEEGLFRMHDALLLLCHRPVASPCDRAREEEEKKGK